MIEYFEDNLFICIQILLIWSCVHEKIPLYTGRVGHNLGLRKRQGSPTSPPHASQILFVYKGLNKIFVPKKLSNFVFSST